MHTFWKKEGKGYHYKIPSKGYLDEDEGVIYLC